jgi:SAM-dependent methyltransferase
MNLQRVACRQLPCFDLIIASNTLEHVPRVHQFVAHAARCLEPHGCMIVAVPPLTTMSEWEENLGNPYHLNLWTPRYWAQVLGWYFDDVAPYRHLFARSDVPLRLYNRPEESHISERDFSFEPTTIGSLMQGGTLSAVFVARGPRRDGHALPRLVRPTAPDRSFTRAPFPLPRLLDHPAGRLLVQGWYALYYFGPVNFGRRVVCYLSRRLSPGKRGALEGK